MRNVDLSDGKLQAKVAEIFYGDAPLGGGEVRLRELQADCDKLCASVPPPVYGRHSERARQLMLLAREYRRVKMGMVNA